MKKNSALQPPFQLPLALRRGGAEVGICVQEREHVVNSADCCSHMDADIFYEGVWQKALSAAGGFTKLSEITHNLQLSEELQLLSISGL